MLLKLGKEIKEPYCLQFSNSGCDRQYNRLDLSIDIAKIAEKATDDELIAFFSKSPAKGYTFPGNFYTIKNQSVIPGQIPGWPGSPDICYN
jgi:hypothetical protein